VSQCVSAFFLGFVYFFILFFRRTDRVPIGENNGSEFGAVRQIDGFRPLRREDLTARIRLGVLPVTVSISRFDRTIFFKGGNAITIETINQQSFTDYRDDKEVGDRDGFFLADVTPLPI
jgi:hypothetical protein